MPVVFDFKTKNKGFIFINFKLRSNVVTSLQLIFQVSVFFSYHHQFIFKLKNVHFIAKLLFSIWICFAHHDGHFWSIWQYFCLDERLVMVMIPSQSLTHFIRFITHLDDSGKNDIELWIKQKLEFFFSHSFKSFLHCFKSSFFFFIELFFLFFLKFTKSFSLFLL